METAASSPTTEKNTSTPTTNIRKWTEDTVRKLVLLKFGKRACWYQLNIALALYTTGKDVVGCAPTGAGKTLSFWIPLLMALEDGKDVMSIVVTPLNLLGKQNEKLLQKAGLPAIAISAKNSTKGTWKDIEKGMYRVVIVNPEILMASGDVERLWSKPEFTKRLLNFIFDEGHCISQWGHFRKEYTHLGALRYLIPHRIPFYIASATLPHPVLLDIIEVLRAPTRYQTLAGSKKDSRDMVHGLPSLTPSPALLSPSSVRS